MRVVDAAKFEGRSCRPLLPSYRPSTDIDRRWKSQPSGLKAGKWANVRAVLSLFLLPPAFFSLFAYLLGRGHVEEVYNSDLLHPYLILEDLFSNIDALWQWHHSPALYAFPDWLIAGAVLAIPAPHMWLPLLYAPIILTAYCLAGGALLAAGDVSKPVRATWMIAGMLFLAGLTTAIFSADLLGPSLFVIAAAPYIHTGATLATLVSAALFLSLLSGRGGRWRKIVLGFIVLATSFSDLLFVAWFVGPSCVVAFMHARNRSNRRGLEAAVTIAGSAIAGVILDMCIHGVLADHAANRKTYAESLWAAWQATRTLIISGDVVVIAVISGSLAMIGRAATILVRGLRPLSMSDSLELFLGISATAALAAPIVTRFYIGIDETRYFLVLGLLASVWTALVVLRLGKRAALVGGGSVLIAGAALTAPAANAVPRIVAAPTLQRCIEAEGRTTGIGDYWTAKLIMFTSQRQIHILQTEGYRLRFQWNYNDRWFTRRSDKDLPARPDFIVTAQLDQAMLLRYYGTPNRIVSCADTALWLYDQPLPLLDVKLMTQ